MNELNYIGAEDLVFESGGGVHSGGFSVNSIMMKSGLSPIMTINTQQIGGKHDKVSDLFNDLVIPNWALSYNNRIVGGKYNEVQHDSDSEDEDGVIDDDLHDKLLELVKEHNIQQGKGLKKKTTRKHRIERKKYTKRRK